jgi:hypothetical protein
MNHWRSGIALPIKVGVSGSSQAMTWVGADMRITLTILVDHYADHQSAWLNPEQESVFTLAWWGCA